MGLGVPEMMLLGAAVGGGSQLLRGKDPLKGALTGAALGGLGGAAGGLMGGGAAAGTAGSGVGGSLGAGAIPTSASAFEASMGLPNSAFLANGGSLGTALGGRASQMGMSAIGGGSTLYNPEYYANVLGNPVYTGGGGLLSQVGTGAGSIWDSAKASLPDYVTPQNVLGAASIISNTPQQQMPVAPGGGVSAGKPSGLNVSMGNAQLIRRRGQA